MMKRFFILCFMLLTQLLVVQAQHTQSKYNIIFIGNSITYGATLPSPETASPPVKAVRILEENGYDVKYANCGFSGSTTVDFLPGSNNLFPKILGAADTLCKTDAQLIFSMMLGTNDSAIKGPTGSPVSPKDYKKNLQLIIDSLHRRYPQSRFFLHQPIWYSPNTHNKSLYLEEGLKRLQTYTPILDALVKENPDYVFKGDRDAYKFFKKYPERYLTAEKGNSGIFFLHPNALGAEKLGGFWAHSLIENIAKEEKTTN